jgi:hypothetical protein
MIFLTGQHHGQDVLLATPLATLRPTQGQSLYQHAMGDTALACFGRIPWIGRQGVRRAGRRQSDNVDKDGNNGDGQQPAARGSLPPPTPSGVDDDNHGNSGVPGGDPHSSDARRGCRRDSSGWPPASRIAWGRAGGGSPCRAATDAAANDANNDGHIGNIQADGVVKDDGDNDDLDDDDDDEGKDENRDNDDDDAVVSGEAAAAAAPTTRMAATMATTTKVTWTTMAAATTTRTSMTSTMTTTTMGNGTTTM